MKRWIKYFGSDSCVSIKSKIYSFNNQTSEEYYKVKAKNLINDFLGYTPNKYACAEKHQIDTLETKNKKVLACVSKSVVKVK